MNTYIIIFQQEKEIHSLYTTSHICTHRAYYGKHDADNNRPASLVKWNKIRKREEMTTCMHHQFRDFKGIDLSNKKKKKQTDKHTNAPQRCISELEPATFR